MARLQIRGSIILAAALGPVSSFASSGRELFERQSCGSAGFLQCSGAAPGFCCDSTSKCILLASNTTVLCCPNGGNCEVINPITCDITQQNVALFPLAQLKTTNLTATLPTCGSRCCPLGYLCSEGSVCTMDANQNAVVPSPTPATTGSSTPPTSAAQSSSSPAEQTCSAFPAAAVLAGLFPGIVAGILLAVASFCLFGAYRRRQNRLSGSFGPVAASISDPIYSESSAMRTDFIRKQGSAPPTPTRQPTIERVRSLFRKSTAATGTDMAETFRAPAIPRTPRLQREPSGESINIFADPVTAQGMRPRDSHQTTFTDMMDRADLSGVARGEPFVPRSLTSSMQSSPSRAAPRR